MNTLWQSQSYRSHHDDAVTNPTYAIPSVNLLDLPESKKWLCQDFQTQCHCDKAEGQVKLTPSCCTPITLTNVPTKYQFSTPYSFRDIAQTIFYRSRSLQLGQRSNQGHTITLHTYTSQPMSIPSLNFLHLTVSSILPGQDFIGQGHNGKVKGQIKVPL